MRLCLTTEHLRPVVLLAVLVEVGGGMSRGAISTRQLGPDGIVQETADLGIGTRCGLELYPDIIPWTDKRLTCEQCKHAKRKGA